ncbi:Gfo/Idh/MocA family protein [Microbacterium marinilacus]|uniref:Gfo/Idh/MocA family oxidoreductase n=1 Tax=Microbacterium marinilacus TaxID=415209 RepID=A0ABP7BK13_9MICO|nr:Gfo/Idh/MocA family oxidoreductase [Microbacterium marinilacus]MBY0687671.1 Gfo/Idh/MocA family oxidoreductase [Microbacterium marinilacus]
MDAATAPLRYAVVGAGARSESYLRAIVGPHRADAELRAIGDVNPGRVDHFRALARSLGGDPAGFAPDALEGVIREHDIDRVIVSSPDDTHAELVDRALRAGADVIVEKPLTIDADGAERIAAAVADTGRSVTATFNYRYSPRNSALAELLRSGEIGDVTSVHFEWMLDTVHGADYFRRWHRLKRRSGGLLVHKAAHHFDLVNWWLDDAPTRVYASGGLRFYGAANAAGRGLPPRPARGSVGPASDDPFVLDMRTVPGLAALYLDNETHDGYVRDLDVFSADMDIEDNLSLVVDYARGPGMTYSLNAHSPWEGYAVSVNGTRGRAELTVVERASVSSPAVVDPSYSDLRSGNAARTEGERLVVQRHWDEARVVDIPDGRGDHGGGDERMMSDLLSRRPEADPLGRRAGLVDGLRAIAVGIAGNESLATGLPVVLADAGIALAEHQGAAR